jgi:glucose-1-phosphate adenylyltransferase
VVSPGCVIRGRVANSVLSSGVYVEEQAIIRNSIVMANTLVGYHSVVGSCIIDEGVQIGRFWYIGFGSSLLTGVGDVTVPGKDVVVPAHTAVGRKCKVLPKAGPGDFLSSLVPADTVVTTSV